jgi:hypothetical protein
MVSLPQRMIVPFVRANADLDLPRLAPEFRPVKGDFGAAEPDFQLRLLAT